MLYLHSESTAVSIRIYEIRAAVKSVNVYFRQIAPKVLISRLLT